MSRFFVDDAPVPVSEFDPAEVISDRAPNVIWIRPKMSVEVKGKVVSETTMIGRDGRSLEFRAGAQEVGLLIHNIIRWEGPDLGGVPCTPDNIRRLDSSEPLIVKVLQEIARRNPVRASGNAATASRSPAAGGSAGDPTSADTALPDPSGSGTRRSSWQSALDGYQARLAEKTPTS